MSCSHPNLREEYIECANGSKQLKDVCPDCDYRSNPKKQPHNTGKKRKTRDNASHTQYHRDKTPDGIIRCAWCSIAENERTGGFEIHHVIALEDGGPDVPENTLPLCTHCHRKQQMDRARVRGLRRG